MLKYAKIRCSCEGYSHARLFALRCTCKYTLHDGVFFSSMLRYKKVDEYRALLPYSSTYTLYILL